MDRGNLSEASFKTKRQCESPGGGACREAITKPEVKGVSSGGIGQVWEGRRDRNWEDSLKLCSLTSTQNICTSKPFPNAHHLPTQNNLTFAILNAEVGISTMLFAFLSGLLQLVNRHVF